jgi:hypothetical protein
MFVGTISPRTVQGKAAAENSAPDVKAPPGGAPPSRGHGTTGKATESARAVQWLKDHPEASDPDVMKAAIGWRKMQDAYNLERDRVSVHGEHPIPKVQAATILLDVVAKYRPGYFTKADVARLKRWLDSGDDSDYSEAISEISGGFRYSDWFGRGVDYELKHIKAGD